MHSLDQQASSIPRRRTSLRERFWSVNSANVLKEADRERRQRDAQAQAQAQAQAAYTTPRHHTAEMTQQQRRAPAGDAMLYDTLHEGGEEEAGGRGDDYALFVERSEMLQEANRREEAMMLGAGTSRTNNSSRRNLNRRSLSRRIADYVKPPRDED